VANAGCELGADVAYTEPTLDWAWAPALGNDTGYVACQDRTIAPFSGTGGQRYFTVAARPDRPNTTSDSSISVQQLIRLESVAGTLSLVDADRLGFSAAARLSSPSTVAVALTFLRTFVDSAFGVLGTILLTSVNASTASVNGVTATGCVPAHTRAVRVGLHFSTLSTTNGAADDITLRFHDVSTSRPVPPALAPTTNLLALADGGEVLQLDNIEATSCFGWFNTGTMTVASLSSSGASTPSLAPEIAQYVFGATSRVVPPFTWLKLARPGYALPQLSRIIDIGAMVDRYELYANIEGYVGARTLNNVSAVVSVEAFASLSDDEWASPLPLGSRALLSAEMKSVVTPRATSLVFTSAVICLPSNARYLRVNLSLPTASSIADNLILSLVPAEAPAVGNNLVRDGDFEGRCWPPPILYRGFADIATDSGNAATVFSPSFASGKLYGTFNVSTPTDVLQYLQQTKQGNVTINTTYSLVIVSRLIRLTLGDVAAVLPLLNDHVSVDAGLEDTRADLQLAASLGGAASTLDSVQVIFSALDATGATLANYALPKVSWAERQNQTTFLRRYVDTCVSGEGWALTDLAAINVSIICFSTRTAAMTSPLRVTCDAMIDDLEVGVVQRRMVEHAFNGSAAAPKRSANLLDNANFELDPGRLGDKWETAEGRPDIFTYETATIVDFPAMAKPFIATPLGALKPTKANIISRPPCSTRAAMSATNDEQLRVSQTVQLCDYADWISAGGATIRLAGWLGSSRPGSGIAGFDLTLSTFGAAQVGPTYEKSTTAWNRTFQAGSFFHVLDNIPVPANARVAVVGLSIFEEGLVDDLCLTVQPSKAYQPPLRSPVNAAGWTIERNALAETGFGFEPDELTGSPSSPVTAEPAVSWVGEYSVVRYACIATGSQPVSFADARQRRLLRTCRRRREHRRCCYVGAGPVKSQ
jgi:hypothetical protein